MPRASRGYFRGVISLSELCDCVLGLGNCLVRFVHVPRRAYGRIKSTHPSQGNRRRIQIWGAGSWENRAIALGFLLVAVVVAVWRLHSDWRLSALYSLERCSFSFGFIECFNSSSDDPDLALLDGAVWTEWKRFEAAAKGYLPTPEDSKPTILPRSLAPRFPVVRRMIRNRKSELPNIPAPPLPSARARFILVTFYWSHLTKDRVLKHPYSTSLLIRSGTFPTVGSCTRRRMQRGGTREYVTTWLNPTSYLLAN